MQEVGENEGRRISRTIERNKGMTRLRKKIDKNSRVKLRRKYEKALKDPKIKQRQVRAPQHEEYTGELTGARAARVRSVAY
jgi:U3 small nucleolar RNA-associated protein 3